MCGRYFIDPEAHAEALARMLAQLQRRENTPELRTGGEIRPGEIAPVLCMSRAQTPLVYGMRWGFCLPDGKRVINARSETAAERSLFRESARLRRCLMPMSGYFEWEKRGSARAKYRILPANGEMACLAGLYRFEGGQPVFTVLTREAAPEIRFIHDRMPVLLPAAAAGAWLRPDSDFKALLNGALTDMRYAPEDPVQLGLLL